MSPGRPTESRIVFSGINHMRNHLIKKPQLCLSYSGHLVVKKPEHNVFSPKGNNVETFCIDKKMNKKKRTFHNHCCKKTYRSWDLLNFYIVILPERGDYLQALKGQTLVKILVQQAIFEELPGT